MLDRLLRWKFLSMARTSKEMLLSEISFNYFDGKFKYIVTYFFLCVLYHCSGYLFLLATPILPYPKQTGYFG